MRSCPVTQCKFNTDEICRKGSCSNYDLYRRVTGKCETCGEPMETHPKCEACGVLCDTGHLEGLPSPYRGYDLCGHCEAKWRTLDKVIGRETTWKEVLSPQPRMFKEAEVKGV